MKFVHLSDLHVGKKLGTYSLKDDLFACMDQVAKVCKTESVDAIIVAGDLYDTSNPSADAMSQVDAILRLLSSTGAKIIIAPGNHDSASRLSYMSSFLEDSGIVLRGTYDGDISPIEFEDEYGKVCVWPIPFVRPVDVRAAQDLQSGLEMTHNDAVRRVIEKLDVDSSLRNVAVSHQFVTSGSLAPTCAGSEMTLGTTDSVSVDNYSSFDYVALGHIHLPQRVGRDTVRYSGSPLKYSKGEARGIKSFPLVTLGEKGSVDVDLIPFKPLHDVRCIKGPLNVLISEEMVSQGETDDYIFATLTDDVVELDAREKLRATYPNLAGFTVENVATTFNVREIDLDAIDSLSPYDLFGEFYERQLGRGLDDAQAKYVADKFESLEG